MFKILISSFNNILKDVDSNLLVDKLLPNYINVSDIGQYAKLYYIEDSSVSTIISILSINSSFWEQFWLNFLVNTNDVDLMNKLVTLQSEYSLVYCEGYAEV
ncbi:MAG: hypothetical protein AN484_27890 [Aphanizomenon flos-aquae WA102]|uniref:Uncharacterized protein n=1 Tax=Aphanizomenon flos-aquae WA102 TaxID=1710896 RepID=A0A1B7W662_APHFL|nr:MAG: hypothetical protein AN484_27890 [Aphanizomenon flos-aquae WA102]